MSHSYRSGYGAYDDMPGGGHSRVERRADVRTPKAPRASRKRAALTAHLDRVDDVDTFDAREEYHARTRG